MKRYWLINTRKDRWKTQEQVSEQVGITQPSYSNIERGKISPSVPTAKAITKVLGFDWTQFYDEAGTGQDQTSA